MDPTHEAYLGLFTFVVTGALFLAATLLISKILRPDKPDPDKLSVYECGEEAVSNGQVRFNSRFFMVALLFVLFEVEIIFLFPWAIVFTDHHIMAAEGSSFLAAALLEMILFVVVLGLGLAYAWARGHLDWVKPATQPTQIDSPVPMELYESFNHRSR